MSPSPSDRSLVDLFPGLRARSAAKPRAFVAGPRAAALALSLVAHAGVAAVILDEGSVSHAPVQPAAERRIAAPELVTAPTADEPSAPNTANTPLSPQAPPAHVQRAPSALSGRLPARESTPSAPEPNVESVRTESPRFVMASAPVNGAPGGPARPLATESPASPASVPFEEHEVDVRARLVSGAPPSYPAGALGAGIEADVPVDLVIDERGAVESARVLATAGYGLEDAAAGAVRTYRFAPARRNGRAVRVRMRWVVRFELR